MPSSRPCCATWKMSGPWSLPTERIMRALPNLLQCRFSQHHSSSRSRWYELIQLTFAWSRADCQQSCGRGNLQLEGCAKYLLAVMASTDTATCRLNICSRLFIKDNWYIGMVMCLPVRDKGLHLRYCSLKLGLPFLSFPFPFPAFPVNFAVGKPPAGLKVEWDGVERGEDLTGAFNFSSCPLVLSVVHMNAHGLACYQLGRGHWQGEPQMELIVGAWFHGKLHVQVQDAPLR